MLPLHFRDPLALSLLALIPLLVARAVWLSRRRPALRFPGVSQLAALQLGRPRRWRWLPLTLQSTALALVALALARPTLPPSPRAAVQEREGIDLAIALDLSSSMKAEDLGSQNRIDTAKDVVGQFVEKRVNDRAALVVFSGKAYTQVPLTLDHQALAEALAPLQAGSLPDGTAIGDAIGVSLNRLRDSTTKSKAVILVTDGDSNAGRISPQDAAAAAKELHIPVFPILVGKPGKARIPVGRDPEGGIVYGQVDAPVQPELLAQIARTTGGTFQRATDERSLREGLNRALNAMEKTRLKEEGGSSNPRDVFASLLTGALMVGALGLTLSQLQAVKP